MVATPRQSRPRHDAHVQEGRLWHAEDGNSRAGQMDGVSGRGRYCGLPPGVSKARRVRAPVTQSVGGVWTQWPAPAPPEWATTGGIHACTKETVHNRIGPGVCCAVTTDEIVCCVHLRSAVANMSQYAPFKYHQPVGATRRWPQPRGSIFLTAHDLLPSAVSVLGCPSLSFTRLLGHGNFIPRPD